MTSLSLPRAESARGDAVAQATLLLRIGFTVAPILFGLDKFANVLTDDWTRYLAPAFNDVIPGSAEDAMYMVGVIEIVAGIVVLVAPRYGGLLVAGVARRHHRQPADRRRLRRHRAARLRPHARRAHAGPAGDRGAPISRRMTHFASGCVQVP